MRWYLVAVVLAAISCKARVYTPCDLARTFKFYYSSYIPEKYVPLAVCIAGYHNYSKSNELRHPDGRISYGYFGLIAKPECPVHILTDDAYFSGDWKCLKSQVIDVPEKLKLYEKLCGPKLANSITCRFNEYFDYAEVLDPVHKDIFALSFGEEWIIDRILNSYNKSDDHDVVASTNVKLQEHNTTSSPDVSTPNTRRTAPESHSYNLASQETTHDKTTPITGIREYTETKNMAMAQIDDVFCFTASQMTTIICTALLAQTLLITAVLYFLMKLRKNRTPIRQTPELKLYSPPTAPLASMEDFVRKPFPGGPS